jgi:hypothetical protein
LKRFNERDSRILAATAAMGRPLVISFRLDRNAKPLNSARISGLVEFDAGDANPGKIPLSHEAWKQVEMSVMAAHSGRVQNTFNLLRVAGFRFHEHPQALELEGNIQLSSRQAMIVSITRFVSCGSLTSMDNVPASLAG